MIDKDIENAKFLIRDLKAMSYNETFINSISNVLSELETWKKIAEKLAEEVDRLEEVLIDNNVEFNRFERCQFKDLKCMDMNIECEDCIIDWARKEVEKDD